MTYGELPDPAAVENDILESIHQMRMGMLEMEGDKTLLWYKLNDLERVLGGSHDRRINRAAISLVGGTERFIKMFKRVPACEPCCPAWISMKMTALGVIAHEVDPAYGSPEGWQHPPHEPHPPLAFERVEDLPDHIAALFMLGAEYWIRGEDDDVLALYEKVWRIVDEARHEYAVLWYYVFFDHEPVRFRMTA